MTVDELLAPHPPRIRNLALEVRALITSTFDAGERVLKGWHALGYREAEAGHVCAIFPFDDRVELVIEHGARLEDPDGILERPDLKQVRFVTLRPGGEVPRDAIRRVLLAALHYGHMKKVGSSSRGRTPRRRSARDGGR